MSVEADRFASLLQAACGVTRQRVEIIDLKATERAHEARIQVGLNGETPISHPTGDDIRSRLGWDGKPIGVGELATWNYLWRDPIQAAVNGLMNSAVHNAVLTNHGFTHWGVGIYSELPPGDTNELFRRRYFIVWVATGIPQPDPVELPLGTPPTSFTAMPTLPSSVVIGPAGAVNVRFAPSLAVPQVDFSTGTTGPLRAFYLGDVEGDSWNGSTRWSALWLPERGGYRYCHSTLRSAPRPVTL